MLGVIGEQLFRAGLLLAAIVLVAYLCFWVVSLLAGRKLDLTLTQEYGKKRH